MSHRGGTYTASSAFQQLTIKAFFKQLQARRKSRLCDVELLHGSGKASFLNGCDKSLEAMNILQI
jgi:hypothetical protein